MKIYKLFNLGITFTSIFFAAITFAEEKDISKEKVVNLANFKELSTGVYVIEDKQHILMVPNVTIIVGDDAALVVDTGVSVESAQLVLKKAKELANDKKLYLTITHFHPEHSFGAQAFEGEATIIYNRAQYDELLQKGKAFRTLFAEQYRLASAMKGVNFVKPDVLYENEAELDLGGRVVKLNYYGAAHTLGDQVITVPDAGVVILGDLLETKSFPIMPWFPGLSTQVDPANWREIFRKVASSNPKIVIPGHGPVGTIDDLNASASHMDVVSQKVTELCAAGKDLPEIQKELTPILEAQHADWELKDWIGMEIQVYYERLCRKQA